jgi:hypothetical protein
MKKKGRMEIGDGERYFCFTAIINLLHIIKTLKE